jgi:phosphoribosylformylglycinamidine (FGAM) synthase PurS component
MNLKLILTLSLFCLFLGKIQAQDNLESLLNIVETGKTYALYKAKSKDTIIVKETEIHYLKLVPAKYKTVFDTIELAPALNGNLDTSNYFIQTEVLVLKEPGAEWKTATISSLCNKKEGVPHIALCLLKTTPNYRIVHRKFFPFKNIMDTTATDFVIPAEVIIVKRKLLIQKAGIYYVTADKKNDLGPGEKIIPIPAGSWRKWAEIVCPFGVFEDPSMTAIQNALKKQSYNVKITGRFDEQTKRQLIMFQKDNMLDDQGSVTPETLNRLGVKRQKLIQINFLN